MLEGVCSQRGKRESMVNASYFAQLKPQAGSSLHTGMTAERFRKKGSLRNGFSGKKLR
jgi:hypothetical protein